MHIPQKAKKNKMDMNDRKGFMISHFRTLRIRIYESLKDLFFQMFSKTPGNISLQPTDIYEGFYHLDFIDHS
jgi:hypothetical protein